MSQERAEIQLESFAGLYSNADPHDVPAANAVIQVNCMSLRTGELQVRGGLREMTYDSE